MKRKLFIDCDPGIDDFVAILAALSMPEFEVVGLCSVSGNVSLQDTTLNLGKILELANRADIPYAKGAQTPLIQEPFHADHVHGQGGLGTICLPEPQVKAHPGPAASFLYECAAANANELTVVAIGPLTNVAIALLAFPKLAALIKEIIFMGGGDAFGNVTPKAEFNIYADPHAAHIVLKSGIPLKMVGLDATMSIGLTKENTADIVPYTRVGKQVQTAFAEMRDSSERFGHGPVAFAHDLTAILCLAYPDIAKWKNAVVTVGLNEGDHLGQTICDFAPKAEYKPNVQVALGVHEERYKQILELVLSRL